MRAHAIEQRHAAVAKGLQRGEQRATRVGEGRRTAAQCSDHVEQHDLPVERRDMQAMEGQDDAVAIGGVAGSHRRVQRAAGQRGRQRCRRLGHGGGITGRNEQPSRCEMQHVRRAQPRQHRAIGIHDRNRGGAIGRDGQRLSQPCAGRLRGEPARRLQPGQNPGAPGRVVELQHVEIEKPFAGIVDDVERHLARRRGGGLEDQPQPARRARRRRPGRRIGHQTGEIFRIGERRQIRQRLDACAPSRRAKRPREERQRGGMHAAMTQRVDQAGREHGLAGARQAGDADTQMIAAERGLGGAAGGARLRPDPVRGTAQFARDDEGIGHRAARDAAQPAGASRGSRRRPRASRLARYSAQIRSRPSPSSRRYCQEKMPVSWRSSKRIRMA